MIDSPFRQLACSHEGHTGNVRTAGAVTQNYKAQDRIYRATTDGVNQRDIGTAWHCLRMGQKVQVQKHTAFSEPGI